MSGAEADKKERSQAFIEAQKEAAVAILAPHLRSLAGRFPPGSSGWPISANAIDALRLIAERFPNAEGAGMETMGRTMNIKMESTEKERERVREAIKTIPMEGEIWVGIRHACVDAEDKERLLAAALVRIKAGHNDTCGAVISDAERYPCSCGHDALVAALEVPKDPPPERP